MDNFPNFKIVLDDFLLPSINFDDFPSPPNILCPPENSDIFRAWAAEHGGSLIVLPPNSNDINPCDVLWRNIYRHVQQSEPPSFKIMCKSKLWETVANTFDFLTLTDVVQFQAALSMRERIEKLERAAGGPIFP